MLAEGQDQIKRHYSDIELYLRPNKVLVVYGPRQVGKTTLVKSFLATTGLNYLYANGGDAQIKDVFEGLNLKKITDYASGYQLMVIDEAHEIQNIGQGLKLLVDSVEGIKVLVTGSSSFELAGQIGEPLTGRKTTLTLFPVSLMELALENNTFELNQLIDQQLIYGNYPEVLMQKSDKQREAVLNEITSSYLLKDVLELDRVKGSKTLQDLLRLMAFQVGSEVSLSEVGSQIGMDNKTVARYLDIFEKAFIIYNLRGYSKNLRDEIKEKSKYYFYDNGIRNALISNFNDISFRNDVGGLWENYVFMERMKKRHYGEISANIFFWRTWDGKEVDLIEERGGMVYGYEVKYKETRVKPPQKFVDAYPNSEFKVIYKGNLLDFVV